VGDDLLDHLRAVVRDSGDRLEIFGGHGERRGDRRRVALVGALDGHAHDHAGLQIDGVLGPCARCERPAFIS
jgi:hypothetical protein